METKTTNVKPVTNTPFVIVELNGKFKVAAGNAIVSEREFNTQADAEKYVKSKPWELIINVCALTQKLIKENDERDKTKPA